MDLTVQIFTVTMGLHDLIVHHECCAHCILCEFSTQKMADNTACLLSYNAVYPSLCNRRRMHRGNYPSIQMRSIKYIDKLLKENISLENFCI